MPPKVFSKLKYVVAALLLVAAVAGCQDNRFPEAAQQLVDLKNSIRDGFAAGDLDAAHGPLHEVGDLLGKMPELAKTAGLSTEQLQAVEDASDSLFDAFDKIDRTFHGQEGSTYDDEAEGIAAAMKVIVEAAGIKDDAPAIANAQDPDDGLPSGMGGDAAVSGTVVEDGKGENQ